MRSIILVLILGFFGALQAQPDQAQVLLNKLYAEDSLVFEGLAFYPWENQQQLIKAGEHPVPLVQMERLQWETSRNFQTLLADLDQEEAAIFYRFARFPDLVDSLAADSNMSKKTLKLLAAQYPTYMQKEIRKYGQKYPGIIQSMHQQALTDDEAFHELIASQPEDIQKVMERLTEFPEVLNLMVNHMHLAILLGELYEVDSTLTRMMVDSAYRDILTRRKDELQAWTDMLQADPVAFAEFRQAAEDFAGYFGLSLKDVRTPAEGVPAQMDEVINPQVYPYWFGYPWWYQAPYWRRSPYWYHTGFYVGKKDTLSFVGLPSYLFIYWHLQRIEQYPKAFEFYQRFWNDQQDTRSAFSIAMDNHCPNPDSIQAMSSEVKVPKRAPTVIHTVPPLVKSYRYFLAVDYHRSHWLRNQISKNMLKY